MTRLNSRWFALALLGLTTCAPSVGQHDTPLRFEISFSEEKCDEALDGRLLLMISNDESEEPRFQISTGPETQLIFGIDVEGLGPGEAAVIDAEIFGYPLKSLSAIPPGEYWVQALLNRYETFKRADGHVVKLPPDKWEGQQWNRKPGNLFSTVQKLRIDPIKNERIRIELDNEIPPVTEPEDTKYIKHVKIQSERLTEFWGQPVYL